ncbi:hypothetical protein [Bradyrhizobium erythrophlei]|uniref:Phage shock protein B n=1 Tax=Bradyrhizobium erythrophlei TaxID=1437360 RepID=A0A1H4UM32_9BRAD|nr:hypothetical protein [Bradyrhizobium erythrophlei]SEC69331.1 hypothetical protein SAMN05444164_2494 [Bradyrhizobium erythrophlei]
MSSLAAFIFLVVIPIWSGAAIIVRQIEAWGAKLASETSGHLSTPEEMERRIALLEDVLKLDRPRVG